MFMKRKKDCSVYLTYNTARETERDRETERERQTESERDRERERELNVSGCL